MAIPVKLKKNCFYFLKLFTISVPFSGCGQSEHQLNYLNIIDVLKLSLDNFDDNFNDSNPDGDLLWWSDLPPPWAIKGNNLFIIQYKMYILWWPDLTSP